ncbi:histidine kinase [Kineococcus sp. NPDC059986]|uniref:sensor histidine kinase n=1 Tax=Kineococcus sp. NPDC059986 TaxID=3155538 RepID=UPI00344C74AC
MTGETADAARSDVTSHPSRELRGLQVSTVVVFAAAWLAVSLYVLVTAALPRGAVPTVAAVLVPLGTAAAQVPLLRDLVGTRGRRPDLRWLGVLAGLSYLPAAVLGVEWLQWAPVPAGIALVALSFRWGAACWVAGAVLQVLAWWVAGRGSEAAAQAGLDYVVSSVVLAVLLRAVATSRELARTRRELARAEVLAERLRMSRDLHDLLGRTLTAISLKAELASRYQRAGRAEQEREQLDDLLALTHAASTDVRSLVTGYRTLSLPTELTASVRLLLDAGVECTLEADPAALTGDLPVEVVQAAAWVVREATTNVLRHARATRCSIDVRVEGDGSDGRLRVAVVNDVGPAGDGARTSRGSGTGLRGMHERVRPLGGSVEATEHEGNFTVICELPVRHRDTAGGVR